MTDEETLFKLYNEAYGGYYNMIVRALRDEDINADNIARYLGYTIIMIHKLGLMSEALSTYHWEQDCMKPSDRVLEANKKVYDIQRELKKRMRDKFK